MGSITIRDLEDDTKQRLRVRAARNRRSMEAEAREILRAELARSRAPNVGLASSVRKRLAALGGVSLPAIPRDPMREPPVLDP